MTSTTTTNADDAPFDLSRAIGVEQAAAMLKGKGKKRTACTRSVRLWCNKGRRCRDGTLVVLRHTRWAGDILFMPEWVRQFEQDSLHHNDSARRQVADVPARSPRSRAAGHRRALEMLDEQGIV